MNALINKHKTFFIFTTAELLGLALSRPTRYSAFFLAWIILSILLLVLSLTGKNKLKSKKETALQPSEETIESPLSPSLYIQALTGKNKIYSLYAVLNIVLYVVCLGLGV